MNSSTGFRPIIENLRDLSTYQLNFSSNFNPFGSVIYDQRYNWNEEKTRKSCSKLALPNERWQKCVYFAVMCIVIFIFLPGLVFTEVCRFKTGYFYRVWKIEITRQKRSNIFCTKLSRMLCQILTSSRYRVNKATGELNNRRVKLCRLNSQQSRHQRLD